MTIKILQNGDPEWTDVISFAENCSWKAGPFLARAMKDERFSEWERVIAAFEGTEPVGFCSLTEYDFTEPEDPGIKPFIGFVFVREDCRGGRLSQRMTEAAEKYAHGLGYQEVYLTSGEEGLYEKYGYSAAGEKMTGHGVTETLFRKDI